LGEEEIIQRRLFLSQRILHGKKRFCWNI